MDKPMSRGECTLIKPNACSNDEIAKWMAAGNTITVGPSARKTVKDVLADPNRVTTNPYYEKKWNETQASKAAKG